MSIADDVFYCHNELNALKSTQQTNLFNLQNKYSYSITRTFTFASGVNPQTQITEVFPKRFRFTFSPSGSMKALATLCCEVLSSNGASSERDIINIIQNIDNSKDISWDICFYGSLKENSDTQSATITFRASCISLSNGSINLTEY